MLEIPLNTDFLVEVIGLVTQSDDAPQTAASVNMTLYDSDGTPVSGQLWPSPLSNINQAGDFRGILLDSLALVRNADYRLEIIADAGANLRRTWDFACKAVFGDGDE